MGTSNNTEIRSVIVFAEGIFKNESIVVYPPEELVSNFIFVSLRPPKDVPVDLHLKALIGYRSSSHYHVFELARHLPRFAFYGLVKMCPLDKAEAVELPEPPAFKEVRNQPKMDSVWMNDESEHPLSSLNSSPEANDNYEQDRNDSMRLTMNPPSYNPAYSPIIMLNRKPIYLTRPSSYATIRVPVMLSKVTEWINLNFVLINEFEPTEEEKVFQFISLRNHKPLFIEVRRPADSSSEPSLNQVDDQDRKVDILNTTPPPSNSYADDSYEIDSSAFENGLGEQEMKVYINNLSHHPNPLSAMDNAVDNLMQLSAAQNNAAMFSSLVTFYSESMELVGNCVQSFAGDFLSLANLPCQRAYFPHEMDNLKSLVEKIESIQNVRQHLMVEVADSANMVRGCVVQAENARLMEE